MNAPRSILVATDLSENSQAALSYARVLARWFDAALHVIYVIEDPLAQGWAVDKASLPHAYERIEREARDRLAEILGDMGPSGQVLVEVGKPAVEIVKYAERNHVELVVTGSRGRGAVEQLLLGSVAEAVVRMAPCPVLVVRPPRAGWASGA